MTSEPIVVLSKIAATFDRLGIPYIVGGSIASSTYGTPRATLDVDVIADIAPPQVDLVISALGHDFDVDPAMVREAVEQRGSFNAIYLATMFKADVFVARDDAWSREELSRGRTQQFDTSEGKVSIRFASAEDTLLHKLFWFQLGNEVSERQWSDVIGMLKIQKGVLDDAYLDQWSGALGVAELLARARRA
jgi:hypothetical protein